MPARLRAQAITLAFLPFALTLPGATLASAQTFKVAYFNIQSGKGEPGLPGRPVLFHDNSNCTDRTQPLNGWGVNFVQEHLQRAVGADSSIVALGLSEAWTCGSPSNVRQVLGWKAQSSERNGVAIVARHGFAGPEEWVQLDTSLNVSPLDTMWVLRAPVCLDAACSSSIDIFSAHWYSSVPSGSPLEQWRAVVPVTYDRQAARTVEFLRRAGGASHILIGDLNAWEGSARVCEEYPTNAGLNRLRDAGYVDAWPLIHGSAEGFTGMTNRARCGAPEGYAWKRPDYVWSPANFLPVSISRFGVVPAGDPAPSDHYGLIAEFPLSGVIPSVRPRARDASLTASAGRTSGSPITWTAQAAGPAGLQFKFVRRDPVRGWRTVQDYGPSSTHTWTPARGDAGEHYMQVWVRSADSTAAYDTWAGHGPVVVERSAPTITAFEQTGTYPLAPGTPVRLTTTASGGSGTLEYRYFVLREGSGWSELRGYSAASTATWTPTQPGTYSLQVWVRSSGSTDAWEAWRGLGPLHVATTPASVQSILTDKPLPAKAGQPVTFSATATGGTTGPLRYRFWRYDGRRGWILAQDYSTASTYTWTPAMADIGHHAVQVWVRGASSSAAYEAWGGTGMFQVVGEPIAPPTLHAGVALPGAAGRPIQWTAQTSGGTGPLQYQFWVLREGTGWSLGRDYGTSPTFSWTPPSEGRYVVQVWIREARSTASYDTWTSSGSVEIGR